MPEPATNHEQRKPYSVYAPLGIKEGAIVDPRRVESVKPLLQATGVLDLDLWISGLSNRLPLTDEMTLQQELSTLQAENQLAMQLLDAMRGVYMIEHVLETPASEVSAPGLSFLAEEANRLIPKPEQSGIDSEGSAWFAEVADGTIVFRFGADLPKERAGITLEQLYQAERENLDKCIRLLAQEITIDPNMYFGDTGGLQVSGRPDVAILLKRFSTV